MAESIDPRFIDKRTAEHYIRLGLLDEKTWEKHLKSLVDVSDKCVEVETAIGASNVFEEDGDSLEESGADSDHMA